MSLNNEDKAARWWGITTVAGLLFVFLLAAGASRLFGLAWFPWEVEMRTQMLRNSNAYVSTQISALRQLATAYADPAASPAQRAAMLIQMRGLADQLPRDAVPVDIAALLSN
jgi:hypothetical protein